MRQVAKGLGLILVVPFYEQAMAGELYNTAAVVDAAGDIMGVYRKHHIPMSAFFNEKFYFRPGNSGFPVFNTPEGKIGVMICYDRHFPESARALALNGAEVIFVPTATTTRGYSRSVWEIELQAHAIANGVLSANRVGTSWRTPRLEHRSDWPDHLPANDSREEVLVADLDAARLERCGTYGLLPRPSPGVWSP